MDKRKRVFSPEQLKRRSEAQQRYYRKSAEYRERSRKSPRRRERQEAYDKTPERKAYFAAYQQRPERLAKRQVHSRMYHAANRERDRELLRQWRRNNPDRSKAIVNAHRVQRPPWAKMELILAIYERAAILRAETGLDYEVDHVIPLKGKLVSGLHVEGNLQIIERRANRAKSNKLLN